jgi:hypothetical protein
MTYAMTIAGLALLAVAVSVSRASWRGEFDRNPFVPVFLLVVSIGAGAAIALAMGGV